MNKLWSDKAWDNYLYWQQDDRKTWRRINDLVKDIERKLCEFDVSQQTQKAS